MSVVFDPVLVLGLEVDRGISEGLGFEIELVLFDELQNGLHITTAFCEDKDVFEFFFRDRVFDIVIVHKLARICEALKELLAMLFGAISVVGLKREVMVFDRKLHLLKQNRAHVEPGRLGVVIVKQFLDVEGGGHEDEDGALEVGLILGNVVSHKV